MQDESPVSDEQQASPTECPKPLTKWQRRILGVLIEKARTTPDAYPLSLNGVVTGVNQKSNRSPLMSLTAEQVEDELIKMRGLGLVAEVHSGGRVPKYRHFGYDYMGVKGVEAAVMTELLLRGEQTAGELRTRASRFEPIADLATLDAILKSLMDKGLVIALTPGGRGQIFTHNLYLPDELKALKLRVATGSDAPVSLPPASSAQSVVAQVTTAQSTLSPRDASQRPAPPVGTPSAATSHSEEIASLRNELDALREQVNRLQAVVDELMS